MDNEKSDRLRLIIQELLSPLMKKIEILEVEVISLKKEQRDLRKLLEKQ